MQLEQEDFVVQQTKRAEWREIRGLGIDVKVEVLSHGERILLGTEQTMRWRCKPSPLRRSWTVKNMEESK
jgi:hypothetical protein